MYSLHIEHEVRDFDMWTTAFNRDPVDRAKSGVVAHRISRTVDDPNYIVIELDFERPEEAAALLHRLETEVWSRPQAAPALSGKPTTRILNTVAAKVY